MTENRSVAKPQDRTAHTLATGAIASTLLADLQVEVVETDAALGIVAHTPELAAYLDGPFHEIRDLHLTDLFPELIGLEEDLLQVAQGVSPRLDLPQINRLLPDGRERRYVSLTALPHPEVVHHLLLMVRDVTGEGRMEQQAMQQLNEIRLLRAKLEAANKRLVRLDAEKSAFLQTAAHDLRAPLTVVKGYVEMVIEDIATVVDRDVVECLATVLRRTQQMTDLVDRLLDVEQIESRQVVLQLQPVDMAGLVEDVGKGFATVAAKKGLALRWKVAPTLARPQADRAQIARALSNMVSNAIKFTPVGGQVDVAGFEAGDKIVIEVSDTGPGISEADQTRLFMRFFRTDEARMQHIPGTGLGLSIMRAIVEQHGGQVYCRSQVGQGSTFGFYLPVSRV